MKKQLLVLASLVIVASMLLAACGGAATPTAAPAATDVPAAATDAPAATAEPTAVPATPTLTPYPIADCQAGKVCIRWFIGLGTGTDAGQLPIEQSVVDDFNASQDKIQLIMEVVPNASARDVLSTEIASGNGPDIVGPVGWGGSNAFYGQWLDIAPYIQSSGFDTSIFDKALVDMYQTEEGQVGLPFAVYPSALYYNTALFDAAGLNYPPAKYGDKYVMPDGSEVDWSWDTLAQVAKLLTVDANGKNATEEGFDANKIVQYGFTWQWEGHPNYWGAYWEAGSLVVPGGSKGSYQVQIPDSWKASWQWTYDGMWGAQPFIPNGAVASSADFGSGNNFNSGKIAMLDNPSWYTCCLGDLKTFDFGAMPSYNGKVAGRIDADTFRILKSTQHPQEAFEAMVYLETTGVDKLVVGTKDQAPAYGALPSIASKRQPWIDAKQAQFPWVKNLQTLVDGLQYPDAPSAEGWMPNWTNAWDRVNKFGSLLSSQSGVDMAKEIDSLTADLTTIFNK